MTSNATAAPVAYQIGLAHTRGRASRKIATATYARMMPDGSIALDYRGTHVVTFTPDGSIILNHGGWPTVTTERRMNDAISGPWCLAVSGSKLRGGVMPRVARPWQVYAAGQTWADRVPVADFADIPGAEAPYSGDHYNPYRDRFGWGDNVADITPQSCILSADLLAAQVRPMFRYVATLQHDNGTTRLEVTAPSGMAARQMVAKAEGINYWSNAIVSVELEA